jgi:hypothetical protein
VSKRDREEERREEELEERLVAERRGREEMAGKGGSFGRGGAGESFVFFWFWSGFEFLGKDDDMEQRLMSA